MDGWMGAATTTTHTIQQLVSARRFSIKFDFQSKKSNKINKVKSLMFFKISLK
jgi:hypothetical protein